VFFSLTLTIHERTLIKQKPLSINQQMYFGPDADEKLQDLDQRTQRMRLRHRLDAAASCYQAADAHTEDQWSCPPATLMK
jgi:hypothetical protein